MGLFSFLKNAGAKIFGGKSVETKEERIQSMKTIVEELGLSIINFDLELDEDRVVVYGQTESQSEKEKIILALGNVEGIATVDDRISVVAAPAEADFYQVQAGDSLSKIAKKYYGNAMKYPEIFEANKPMLKHPDKIYPGQTLRIPKL